MSIILANVLDWAKEYNGEKFHALLCDPPYHLTNGKSARGFMGKAWDGGDIAFDAATWAALGEHLHPGAFGMAFASSRGWHRLAVAIEDAGFIIHPSIFGWAQGQGFPKATRIKDKRFEGHRYGMQALKPALEPIIVFQKPYEQRPLDDIIRTGAGALNIEGSRVGTETVISRPSFNNADNLVYGQDVWTKSNPIGEYKENIGRWGSNLILLDEAAAQALDHQSGTSQSGSYKGEGSKSGGIWKESTGKPAGAEYGDRGGASRFFYQVESQLEESDPVLYCGKASHLEKEAGLDAFPLQVGGSMEANTSETMQLGQASLKGTPMPRRLTRNPHPTVKPIALAKYLSTILLPPLAYAPRRILIPFAGVGSEMIGAQQAGWEETVGIELEVEYAKVAAARIEYWSDHVKPQKTKAPIDQLSMI